MAENFYTILTQVGLAKVANSQITSSKIDISKIAVGDGNGAYYDPASNATALKRKVWEGAVGSVEIDTNNPNWVVVETVIPSTVGGFTVREVGLFDVAGDLIAIGKYPETYKPVLAEGSSKDLYIRMIIEVSNATAVTLKVDPAIIIASRKYVDDKVASSTGSVNEAVQKITDGTLTITPLVTADKTLAGAINEVSAKTGANATALTTHLAEKASKTKLGHVMADGETITVDENGIIRGKQVDLSNYVQKNFSLEWITPTMLNGWTNFGNGTEQLAFCKDELGYVMIRGMLKGGTAGTVCVLPAGFRPLSIHYESANSHNGTAVVANSINIEPNGTLKAHMHTIASLWLSISARFKAEQ